MKQYFFMIALIAGWVGANEIDFFAESLSSINLQSVQQFDTILKEAEGDENKLKEIFIKKNTHILQDWIEWMSKQKDAAKRFKQVLLPDYLDNSFMVWAYRSNLVNVAKKFIEKASDIVTKPREKGKTKEMLLFELISRFRNPFEIATYNNDELSAKNKPVWKQEADNQIKIMLEIIKHSKQEDLLTFENPDISYFPTALDKAVNVSCLKVVEALLKKAPTLIDPDLYGKEGENDVVRAALTKYSEVDTTFQDQLNSEIINNTKDVVGYLIQYGKIDDQSRYDELLDFMATRTFYIVMDKETLSGNNQKLNKQFFDGLYEIFTTIIQKNPIVLKNRMARWFNDYLDYEQPERGRQFLKYAIEHFNNLYSDENFKFLISEKLDKLIEKGLKENQSYTLDEILQTTGLR